MDGVDNYFMKEKTSTIAEIHLYLRDSIALASDNPYKVGQYNGKYLLFAFYINNLSIVGDTEMPVVFNYTWLGADIDEEKDLNNISKNE